LKLLTTSVVRGSQQGQSHGGVYLIDLEAQSVLQTLDWNRADIDWQGRGWDRGLRGIAFDGNRVYIAASDELFAFSPDFRHKNAWRNRYLKHCHEMCVYERTLFIASTGFDSILAFDLDRQAFTWALQVLEKDFHFSGRVYDPQADDGPLMLNKLHINSVWCDPNGMYITGLRTGGMLHFNGKTILMWPSCHRAPTMRDPSGTVSCSTTATRILCAMQDVIAIRKTGSSRCPSTRRANCYRRTSTGVASHARHSHGASAP
jgi:hypothetical protein